MSDIDILNFALNLEYLEAEFYTVATTGMTIDHFGIAITGTNWAGTAGATTGGGQVPFGSNPLLKHAAQELAVDERYHVSLLQNTIISLGGTPINKPAIKLDALGAMFYQAEVNFLTLARIFEEIGVTAYGGAANLLSNKSVVGYAARILATEAEHVGFLRALINQYQAATSALDSVDIIPPPSGTQFFSTNSDSITFVRSPAQVLYLAFGAPSATSGGFFPGGINGNPALGTSSAAPASTDATGFTLEPNPIVGSGGLGTTTAVWAAPSNVQYVQIHIGSPTGPLFATGLASGSATTGAWVTDGMLFYLQDATYPNNLSPSGANTLAVAIARVM